MQLHQGMTKWIDIDPSHTANGNSIVERIEEVMSPLITTLFSDCSRVLTLKWYDPSRERLFGEVSLQKHYVVSVCAPNGSERVYSIPARLLWEQTDMIHSVIQDMAKRVQKYWDAQALRH